MNPDNPPPLKYWYGVYEGYEARCQRRLQVDLGLDETTAEAIIRLRRQVLDLQSRIHLLEADLADRDAIQHLRLSGCREAIFEAAWIEVEIQG